MSRPARLWAVAAVAAGCDGLRVAPECPAPETVISGAGDDALTCADVLTVRDYSEVLALRPTTPADRRSIVFGLLDGYTADPIGTRAAVDRAGEVLSGLRSEVGAGAAEHRGSAAWSEVNGEGPLSANEKLRTVVVERLSVWFDDDEARLVLTEHDVEGWIRYASLCREAQGGGPLRVSMSDRVEVYRMLVDRYRAEPREGRLAILAVGAHWGGVRERWKAASYEQQQQWIARAPLPPPMSATSLGYIETLFNGDLGAHAAALHEVLGPMPLQRGSE
jgi:hypothetical protein